MNPHHLNQVTKLSDQLGYPVTESDLEGRFQKLILSKRHGFFVYVRNEIVLGWIHLEIVEDLIEEDKVEIKAIIVDENFRGNGIGKALINAAEKWAKTYQLHTIYLNCNILREQTHKFYQQEGFTQYKTSLFFEKRLNGLYQTRI